MSRFAAVDIGTNTVRLVVVDDRLEHVDRGQRITRLGKGVDSTRSLDAESMERTLGAVREFVVRARELGAERIRVAGTSALRDAANGDEFLRLVRETTELDVEILAGETEGRLAYRGATGWLEDGDYIVCDIGGGSTEVITAADAVSIDVGSVRIRERFFSSDAPQATEVGAARNVVRAAMPTEISSGGRLVGVAGTITTLAALVLGLPAYDSDLVHGSRVTRAAVDDWSRRLLAMSSKEIATLGPVEPGREDVIGAGSLILSVVMEMLDAPDVLVSERDILDGLVADLVR